MFLLTLRAKELKLALTFAGWFFFPVSAQLAVDVHTVTWSQGSDVYI